MVETDVYLMELVEPRTSWIMTMGYEVDELILDAYAQDILKRPIDPNEERLCTFKEKNIKVHLEVNRPGRERRVRKEVENLVKSFHIPVQNMRGARKGQIELEEKREEEPINVESTTPIFSSSKTR